MHDETSSLPYWDDRWGKAPTDFRTSWPDNNARALELAFIHKAITPVRGRLVELGCGNLQLLESPDLHFTLSARHSYVGVDGSAVALEAARRRAAKELPLAEFVQHDLSVGPPPVEGDFVLSKRTIQNLHPDSREWVWDYL